MYRAKNRLFKVCTAVQRRGRHVVGNVRANSTSSGSSGGGGFVMGVTGVSAAVIAGSTAYAKYDEQFRTALEDKVPMVKPLFAALLGDETTVVKQLKEKDLSIPFEASSQPTKEGSKHDAEDEVVVAVNVLDAPTVSMIDLDISNHPHKEQDHHAPEEESSFVIIEETPAVDTAPVLEAEEVSKSETILLSEENLANEEVQATTEFVLDEPKMEVVEEVVKHKQTTLLTENEVIPEENVEVTSEPLTHEVNIEEEALIPISENGAPLTPEEVTELTKMVDGAALEVVLESTVELAKMAAEAVTEAQNKAAESLKQYVTKMTAAVSSEQDEESESLWAEVASAENVCNDLLKEVEEKRDLLKQQTENMQILSQHFDEEQVIIVEAKNVDLKNETLERASREAEFIKRYKQIVEGAPDSLQTSLRQFTAHLMQLVDENIHTMSTQEALLSYALQSANTNRIQRSDVENSDVFKKTLAEEREIFIQQSQKKLQGDLKTIETEMKLEHETKLRELEEKYELEMLAQLKRQTNAHNQHLLDKLQQQHHELNMQHAQQLEVRLEAQKQHYQTQLEKNLAKLNGIESKIADVVDVEASQRRSQELLVASQSMKATLKQALVNGRTRSLVPEMLSLLQIGGECAVLKEIVDSFPQEAAEVGVVPEKDLLRRFERVRSVCKGVAGVGDQGGGIATYAWSYLRSWFAVSWGSRDYDAPLEELPDAYELLARADHAVGQGDLMQAAKYMSQLRGAARALSEDWLREAVLLLETKQAANVLNAYVSSLGDGMQ